MIFFLLICAMACKATAQVVTENYVPGNRMLDAEGCIRLHNEDLEQPVGLPGQVNHTSSHTGISMPLYTTTILCNCVLPTARFTVSVSA